MRRWGRCGAARPGPPGGARFSQLSSLPLLGFVCGGRPGSAFFARSGSVRVRRVSCDGALTWGCAARLEQSGRNSWPVRGVANLIKTTTTNWCLGGFRRTPATSGDTCDPDEARRAGSMEKMEKKQGASPGALRVSRSHQSPPTTPAWSPLDGAAQQSALQSAGCHRDKSGCGQPARTIDQCWAPRRRAAGHAAAPPQQIHHDAAAALGRPPTEHWLPNRGSRRVSLRSCGKRRPRRRATPHR